MNKKLNILEKLSRGEITVQQAYDELTPKKRDTQIHNPLEINIIKQWCKKNKYFKPKYLENCDKSLDKLIHIDKYTPKQICQAILNAHSDEFWKTQFHSPNKLRNKNKDNVLYIDVFLGLKPPKKTKTTSTFSIKNYAEKLKQPIK